MYVCMYVCVDSESYTTTAAPEKPRNPLAVSGTWHSIDLGHRALQQRVSGVCMYVSQCLYISMYGLDWKCRRCFIMYANSEYIVCMYVCMYVCVLVRW